MSRSSSPDSRALIVDDNATNRRILVAQLGRWEMQARATKSAAEALRWLQGGERFDVVLLDFVMPDMDGQALADAINASLGAGRPPLVMVSSFGRPRPGPRRAIDAFLTKPVKPSVLHDALATVLAGAGATVRQRRAPEKPVDRRKLGERYPLRILLAEDNAVNQKLALRLLEKMGYAATVASNGREAVEAVERDPFDVVLMDVQMPEMDGLEATRRILAAHGAAGPRIVAMTANAMAEDREACLAAGMADYLTKPIRVEELADALARSAIGARVNGAVDRATLDDLLDEHRRRPGVRRRVDRRVPRRRAGSRCRDAAGSRRGRRDPDEPRCAHAQVIERLLGCAHPVGTEPGRRGAGTARLDRRGRGAAARDRGGVGARRGGARQLSDGQFAMADVPLTNGRVLVVEDALVNRMLIERLLREQGHSVVAVADGISALERLGTDGEPPFDVVLLDLVMPELDGYGVLGADEGRAASGAPAGDRDQRGRGARFGGALHRARCARLSAQAGRPIDPARPAERGTVGEAAARPGA